MSKDFSQAFVIVLRNALVQQQSVTINNLGTFKTVHVKQVQEKDEEGNLIMMPPKDVIEFIPHKEES